MRCFSHLHLTFTIHYTASNKTSNFLSRQQYIEVLLFINFPTAHGNTSSRLSVILLSSQEIWKRIFCASVVIMIFYMFFSVFNNEFRNKNSLQAWNYILNETRIQVEKSLPLEDAMIIFYNNCINWVFLINNYSLFHNLVFLEIDTLDPTFLQTFHAVGKMPSQLEK